MTYGQRLRQCSEYCSGYLSFRLNFGSFARQLQPLESALDLFWRRMDIPLRCNDAAVSGNPHDGESVYSRFPKPSQQLYGGEKCSTKSAGGLATCPAESSAWEVILARFLIPRTDISRLQAVTANRAEGASAATRESGGAILQLLRRFRRLRSEDLRVRKEFLPLLRARHGGAHLPGLGGAVHDHRVRVKTRRD